MTDIEPKKVEIEIIPTTAAHIRDLVKVIRDEDRQEVESFGVSIEKGLWRSFKGGLGNRTAFIDGKIAAIWGVGGVYMGKNGKPWLLTSTEVDRISPLRFARIYQQEVYKMLDLFPRLENFVDSRYNKAIRLLKIIGFDIGEPEKIGNGMFCKFSMARA